MSYFLNLSLPLWVYFVTLSLISYTAVKYYKWKSKYYALKYAAQKDAGIFDKQLSEEYRSTQKIVSNAYNKIRAFETEKVEREKLIVHLRFELDKVNSLAESRLKWAEDKEEECIGLTAENISLSDGISLYRDRVNELEAKCKELATDITVCNLVNDVKEVTILGFEIELKSETDNLKSTIQSYETLINKHARTRKALQKIKDLCHKLT